MKTHPIRKQLLVTLVVALAPVLMAGCAAFEGFPADVHQHITHPLDGHLYDPVTMDNYQTARAPEARP